MALHHANQVAQEEERALENAHKMELSGREVLPDFTGQVRDARGQFFLIDQDGGFRTRHGERD